MNSKKKPSNLSIIRSLLTFKTAVSIECNRVGGWKLDCKGLGSELMLRKEAVSMTTLVRSLTCERKVRNRMVTWVKVSAALNVFMDHGEGATKNS